MTSHTAKWQTLYQQAYKEAEADLARAMPLMAALRDKHKDMWGWTYAWRLMELQEFLYRFQPKVIMELGCGFTTHVFARHVEEFGGTLTTVENLPQFAERTKKYLTPEQVAKTQWFLTNTETRGGVMGYSTLPKLDRIDLLYVDGPNNTIGDRVYPTIDSPQLCKSGHVEHVLFDWRHTSVDLFVRECGEKYEVEYGAVYQEHVDKPYYLRRCMHHTWARRKA